MSKDTQTEPVYSPEIRALAYAMENMSYTELCAAIFDIDKKAHAIGFENGKFACRSREKKIEQSVRIDELENIQHKDMKLYNHPAIVDRIAALQEEGR